MTPNDPATGPAAARAATTGCTDQGCPQFVEAERARMLSRRALLGGVALGAASATASVFGDTFVTTHHAQAAEPGSRPDVLVVVSMRGAADGLSIVVPHHDPAYYSARPTIAVPKSKLIAMDSHFGLHPALEPLLPMWEAGTMAAVHATGLTIKNRSHFSAMEELEEANPGSETRSGWLNRLVGRDGTDTTVDLLSYAGEVPSTLVFGDAPAFSTRSLDDAQLAGPGDAVRQERRRRSLEQVWGGARGAAASAPGTMAAGFLDALDTVTELEAARQQPTAAYPNTDLAKALRDTARTIKADVGAEAITVDTGSWDFHTGMGTLTWGSQVRRTKEFAEALAAFFADLGAEADRVTVVTLSEFGRRVRENASGGTDHGHGNVMLLLGAGVRGGHHGTWPGLEDTPDGDLVVTTDYRHVLSEVITARFGSASGVFPGFTASHLGVMRP